MNKIWSRYLVIWKETKEIGNINRKESSCDVNKLYISNEKKKWYEYELITNLSNTKTIQIWYEISDDKIKWLRLPKTLSAKLADFLSIQHDPIAHPQWKKYSQSVTWNELFDCWSFAHYLHNIKEEKWLKKSRNINKYKEWNLKIGDVVLTWQGKWKVILWETIHYSVYIWDWFFIGKFWPYSKGINVTTLKEIWKYYPYDTSLILRPK